MSSSDRLYTKLDLDEVSNNPEWTEDDIAAAKRIDDIDPALAANIRRALRPHIRPPARPSQQRPLRKPIR